MERQRANVPTPFPVSGDVALDQRLCSLVANFLREGEGCSVLVLRALDVPGRGRSHQRPPAALTLSERLDEVARRVRTVVRSADPVEVETGRAIGVVLPSADAAGVQSVRRRLTQLLERPDAGYSPIAADEPIELSLGYATREPVRELSAVSEAASALVRAACAPVMLVSAVVGEPDRPGVGMECLQAGGRSPSPSPSRRGGEPEGSIIPAPRATGAAKPEGTHPCAGAGGSDDLEGDGQRGATIRAPERMADSVGWREWAGFLSDLARQVQRDDGAQSRALRCRADGLGVPYMLALSQQSDACLGMISPELARELGAVPIGRERGILTVAMRDPDDTAAMSRLRLASGMAIFPVLADRVELERALGEMERSSDRTPRGL